MSRISVPAVNKATGTTAEVFARIKKVVGGVPNAFAVIGALQPAALGAVLDADAALAAGARSNKDIETVKLVVSVANGCDYCVAAHSLQAKLAGLKSDELKKIRAGEPIGDARRDALVRFVRTLAKTSGTVSDDDFAAIEVAGYTDARLVDRLLQRFQSYQRHRDRLPRSRVKRLPRSRSQSRITP